MCWGNNFIEKARARDRTRDSPRPQLRNRVRTTVPKWPWIGICLAARAAAQQGPQPGNKKQPRHRLASLPRNTCASMFPLRFRRRFRYVSVTVSVTFPSPFPLRFHWASMCATETIQKLSQRFRGPLSIYVYICSIHMHIHITHHMLSLADVRTHTHT